MKAWESDERLGEAETFVSFKRFWSMIIHVIMGKRGSTLFVYNCEIHYPNSHSVIRNKIDGLQS